MRVWRGIFTKESLRNVLSRGFHSLPVAGETDLNLILDKILDNFSNDGDTRKLTSFSKSKLVASRHAGNKGWLLQVEVDPKDILDVEPLLESYRNGTSPNSSEWNRLTEAKDMAHHDKEVFLRHNAKFQVVDVVMVGSW